MTMLDDDRLAALVGRAAEAFEVPASGPSEILARARGGATPEDQEADGAETGAGGGELADEDAAAFAPPGRSRRFVAAAGRHRTLSAAACIVVALVVAGTIGAAVRSPSNPTVHTALKAGQPTSPARSQTPHATTSLPGDQAPAGPVFGAQGTKGAAGSSSAAAGTAPGANTNLQTAPSLPHDAVGQSTKIEQTGTLSLTVGRGNLARTLTRLSSLATSVGGFVASSQSQSGAGGVPYGTITLQVPVDNFAAVLKQAEQYGKASNISTKATDVTGQYVDLQARLASLELSRQQYLTILAKATSIGDILAVQEQLNAIESQIEQLQGQLQVLTSETSYSTLTATVGEGAHPPRPRPVPESGLVQSWHDGVGGFVAGVEGTVRLAGPFLFALLCLAVVAIGGRLLWRRYQRHRL